MSLSAHCLLGRAGGAAAHAETVGPAEGEPEGQGGHPGLRLLASPDSLSLTLLVITDEISGARRPLLIV